MATLWEYLWAGSAVTKWLYHLNWNSNDASGNGNNGTATNVTWVDGRFWKCASLSWWTSGLISMSSAWMSLTTFNHSAWFYTGSTSIQAITWWSSNWCPNINLVSWKITLARQNQLELISSTIDYPLNSRVFVSVNYTQSWWSWDIELYVDWQLNNTNTITNTFSTYWNFQIWRYATFWTFNWQIDEVIIENRAWTPEEVQKYYTYAKGRFGIT